MRFDFFSDEELMQVHEATLKILGTIGIHTLSERLKSCSWKMVVWKKETGSFFRRR